jgi:hypothetical protein
MELAERVSVFSLRLCDLASFALNLNGLDTVDGIFCRRPDHEQDGLESGSKEKRANWYRQRLFGPEA